MQNRIEPLEPELTYHIFNRANGNDNIFTSDENYRFFLAKYRHYLNSIADTFCYCLMPNHFHFLVRIKSARELNSLKDFPKFETVDKLLSKQFSNLFSSYTQSFNKVMGRKGSLFMKSFKRKRVANEKYFIKLVHYIHYNPVESGLKENIEDWKYSSYRAMITSKPTDLLRDEVLDYFSDRQNFIYCHRHPAELAGVDF